MERRDSLKAIGLGLGAALISNDAAAAAVTPSAPGAPRADDGAPSAASDTDTPSSSAEREEAPWQLLMPYESGKVISANWRIESLSPVEKGAAVALLSDGSGLQAKLHICKRGSKAIGVASSRFFDLILTNGGNGQSQTNEQLATVIFELAKHIERNEASVASSSSKMSHFLTHDERVKRFGPEVLL